MPVEKKSELVRSVGLKLLRAQCQLKGLLDNVGEWGSRNEFQARREYREGRMGYRLIQGEFKVPPPLDDWSLLIGEYIHNLRSALDNLAFALARLKKDPPDKPKLISFPIYDDKNNFEQKARPRLRQLPTDAAILIQSLQPFQRSETANTGRPDQDMLLLLQRLSNSDKHQVPSVVLLAPERMAHNLSVEFRNAEEAASNIPPDMTLWNGPIYPGVVLVEHRTKHPIVSVKGEVTGMVVAALELDNKPLPIDRIIPQLGYYTDLIIGQFNNFFVD